MKHEARFTSSPWGFQHTSLERQCTVLRELDMEGICGQFMPDRKGLFSPGLPDEEIRRSLEIVRTHGLRYASFNAGGDFMVPAEALEHEIDLCCRQIDRAALFRPEVIIVFAGWQDRTEEVLYDQVAGALRRVARHAERHGLTVALENHGGLTATVSQCNRILASAGARNLGLNFDPANFFISGQDPLEALRQLEAPVFFTHFKSVRREPGGKKFFCRLRDGCIDYPPIIRLLAERYRGWYAIEYEDPDDVEDGTRDDLAFLRALLAGARPAPSDGLAQAPDDRDQGQEKRNDDRAHHHGEEDD